MKSFLAAIVLLCLLATSRASAETQVLDAKMHHLRSGTAREWSTFPEQAESDRLTTAFEAKKNAREQVVSFRHHNIKHAWQVTLNGKPLGRLPRDENKIITTFSIDAGRLIDGKNELVILPANKQNDDIMIGDIRLEDRPAEELLDQAHAEVRVTDSKGKAIPCRLTIVDEQGFYVPLGATSNDRLAVRNGVIYTRDGKARFGLTPGNYTIYATRGFEYGIDSETITLSVGNTKEVSLRIAHEVDTRGYVSCDTHSHTVTYSGHGDASIEERMLTIAGEGLELPVAADHNKHIDYDPIARKQGVRQYFTPIIGNEVTTPVGHFNIFPIQKGSAPPDFRSRDWAVTFANIAKTPGWRVTVLNHARDLHSGHRPFGPQHHNALVGENLHGWKLGANAMELVNSAALQTDVMRLYHDWFGLLNRGIRITPVGSSDSHEVTRKIVGQGRTFIACPDGDPGNIDVDMAVKHFLEGRVLVSMGLLTKITVDKKYWPGDLVPVSGKVNVHVSVQGPSWTRATKVTLFANGVKIREAQISQSTQESPIKWSGSWQLDRPKHDLHLVAVALGPGNTAPYWPIANAYQPTSPDWTPYVIGSTGAVWLDADGDGKASCAFDYASRLFKQSRDDLAKLVKALDSYDQTVAIHVANLLAKNNRPPTEPAIRSAFNSASEETKEGFRRFFESWRLSQTSKQ